ncbi:MAG: phosphoribosylaminoimidazolesuccinocarboxamide synthase [Chitinispirillaceae bacterium]|nr:phosphoribosylaminoimidazolesuccinocarboxamide synthase [Chitinispirillaceae bacterium]
MISAEVAKKALKNAISNTDFINLPGKRSGKVRDIFDLGDKLVLVTTDRLSAFDRIIAVIPFKGQVLNMVSAFWFENTKDIVPNHVLDVPDPNITIAKKYRVLPIEFVVRGYLTGSTETSAWTLYSRGIREICGNILPDGMRKNQKFEEPIITPTTKSDVHDEPISGKEIVERGILTKEDWEKAKEIALALFKRGCEVAKKNGLILVDTKYEFGMDDKGKIVLIDEIHTPDSSRYWIAASYEERFREGKEPENIDKEFIRLWFREHCDPYKDKVLPEAPIDLVAELSIRYVKLYEMITGNVFTADIDVDSRERIKNNLK